MVEDAVSKALIKQQGVSNTTNMGNNDNPDLITQKVREIQREDRDIESRKTNIIIYKLPESMEDNEEGNKKDDQEEVLQLLQTVNKKKNTLT